jgi:hypothetical protein
MSFGEDAHSIAPDNMVFYINTMVLQQYRIAFVVAVLIDLQL